MMQQAAKNEREASKPFSLHFGEVTGVDPLKIKIDQKHEVEQDEEERLFLLTDMVRDHYVWMIAHDNTADGDSNGAGFHDQVTTKQNQDHGHVINPGDVNVIVETSGGVGTGQNPAPIQTQTQSQHTDHDHNYHYRGGVFKAKYGLKKGESVVLLQAQGGQSYIVLARFQAPKGAEGSGDDESNSADHYAPDKNGDREGYT